MSLTTIYSKNGEAKGTAHIPSVMRFSPIRPDIVHFVHTNLAKNHRQPYGRWNRAGHQHSAESWGTGRAVARVPRISGSGTNRNGQGAFANMTRGGRMFSPLKVWRRWHRLVNISQRRYAICSALAASAVPALVMARGHKINNVPEIPLVVSDEAEEIKKTKEAVKLLQAVKASADVRRSADSRKIRAGIGKMRNRRYVQRKGVLVIHNKKEGLSRAIRNISGAECRNVNRLNIKDLAPGGHIGRFIIWTEGAFKKLDQLYGTRHRNATLKHGYRHPTSQMTTTDLDRIVQSANVQKCIRPLAPKQPRLPKLRRDLILVRKIRRNTILNSRVLKDRKARLDKLRELKKLPPKPNKDKKTKKRVGKLDVNGVPVNRKEKHEFMVKKAAERKVQRAEKHKKVLEWHKARKPEVKARQKARAAERATRKPKKQVKPTTKK